MTEFKVERLAPVTRREITMFMICAVDRYGVRTPIYRTMSADETRTHTLAVQIAGCEECQKQYLHGVVGPRHIPSSRCHDGGLTVHCKCPACY